MNDPSPSSEKRHLFYLLFWPAFGLRYLIIEQYHPARGYYPVSCLLDEWIPFQEVFLIPYFLWHLCIIGMHLWLCFRDVPVFRRYSQYLIVSMSISTAIFLLFPTCQNLRPEVFARDNFLTELMAWFYTTDTSTNVCPSLHVCGSLAAAFGLMDTKRFSAPGRRAIMAVAMTICLSTVFVKQHSILDMLWGFGFSGLAWMAVYGEKTSEFFRIPFLASRPMA